MKILTNKKFLFLFLLILVLILFAYLPSNKKQQEVVEELKEAEVVEIKDYQVAFENTDPDIPESVTPDEVIDLVIANGNEDLSRIYCDTKEDGTKYEVTDRDGYRDMSQYFDLNSDGTDELLILPVEICGNVIRGASGNGPIYIFQKNKEEWVKIGELNGNLLRIENEKTNGYNRLNTNYHMSVNSGIDYFYEYVDGSYQMVFESEYNSSNNKED